MPWAVNYTKRAIKALPKLPRSVISTLLSLQLDMEQNGPVRGNWPNYTKLGPNRHHCHLKKGHPTYVAVWEEIQGKIQLIEVKYVGTHEKAPY